MDLFFSQTTKWNCNVLTIYFFQKLEKKFLIDYTNLKFLFLIPWFIASFDTCLFVG
jgi:hypothetical protein